MLKRGSKADIVAMATHGRRGFKRFFLGSIAELVLRESVCPVLTVRCPRLLKTIKVGTWMTKNPVTATPHEKLYSIAAKMHAGLFRSVPIGERRPDRNRDRPRHPRSQWLPRSNRGIQGDERTTGDRDAEDRHSRSCAHIARAEDRSAAVVEDGKLAGVITTTDLLEALTAQ